MITLTPPRVASAADLASAAVVDALYNLGRGPALSREDVRDIIGELRRAAAFLEPLTSALPTRDELAARAAVARRFR